MSESFTPKPTPVTVDDVSDKDGNPGWASRVRSAILRDGVALRVSGHSIEARSLTTNEWQPIMLPGGGICFADAATAGRVLGMVTGSEAIRNIITK